MQTRVRGALSDVVDGSELALEPCGSGLVQLSPGTKRIRVTNPAGFAVSRLWLEPTDPPAATASSSPSVQVRSWSSTTRSVTVTAEDSAVLTLPQSDNRGWQARYDGATLETVVIDGWKQGWLLPAGTSGEVTLEFAPQTTFRTGILVGGALAVLLNVAAAVTFVLFLLNRRRRRAAGDLAAPEPAEEMKTAPAGSRVGRAGLVAGAVLMAVVSVPLCLGALAGYATRRSAFIALSAAVAVALLVAALAAVVDPGSVVTPPVGANVLAALVVGLVAGRVLGERDVPMEERR